jgi:hypothetical protein
VEKNTQKKRFQKFLISLFAIGIGILPLWAEPPRQLSRQSTGNPLLQHGPWNRNLDLYESSKGIRFEYQKTFVERAGVPNLVRAKDGKIYAVFQWFPLDKRGSFDRIAVSSSADEGANWSEPQTISIKGMPDYLKRSFDPTLVVLDNGKFRLYFSSQRRGSGKGGNRAIFSATSSDAIHYDFEEGERFGFEGEETYDVSVAFFQGKWHLFCPAEGQGNAYHGISDDGLNFSVEPNIELPVRGTWIGNLLVKDNELYFYGSGPGRVWSAVSSDGSNWQLDDRLFLEGGDPAVIQKKNGSLLSVVTGQLRNDLILEPHQEVL